MQNSNCCILSRLVKSVSLGNRLQYVSRPIDSWLTVNNRFCGVEGSQPWNGETPFNTLHLSFHCQHSSPLAAPWVYGYLCLLVTVKTLKLNGEDPLSHKPQARTERDQAQQINAMIYVWRKVLNLLPVIWMCVCLNPPYFFWIED